MNFSQLHERLRVEMLRRIERGSLSTSLLARKTNFQPAHISNFLHRKRMLSLQALDRILASENLTIADLLPDRGLAALAPASRYDVVPLVSHAAAIHEMNIPAGSVLDLVRVQSGLLTSIQKKCSPSRRSWERFVAVRISEPQAESMRPVLRPKAILLIDRQYNSLVEYSSERKSIYAVRDGNLLRFRYVELASGILLLRPHNRAYAVEMLNPPIGKTYRDLLVGRVFHLIGDP
jgi:hypothetical protein